MCNQLSVVWGIIPKLKFRVLHWVLLSLLVLLQNPTPSFAQFGLSSLLNPEGLRIFPYTLTIPRHPGKPDLRWTSFDWKYVDREVKKVRFRIYFYPEEEWVIGLVIPRIESEIQKLVETFNYAPTDQFYYLLLGSRREFQQINIFNISEGVQGITSTTERTMAIPYWGEQDTYDHISTHEMVHQFQVQKVKNPIAMATVPLWFIEGMAEYYSLNGVDPETKQYVRDLLLNPNPDHDQEAPKLFGKGPMNFVQVYKMGQVRIDFFEKQFGPGTVQKFLTLVATEEQQGSAKSIDFQTLVLKTVNHTPETIEKLWQEYLAQYRREAEALKQPIQEFKEITELGENMDIFQVSPNQELIAVRAIDPMTGVCSIQLRSFKNLNEIVEVAADHTANLISLFFMQIPNLALSNSLIAYIGSNTEGPELEFKKISMDSGQIKLKSTVRLALHRAGIREATSPTISPDGKKIAFVGLTAQGWENIYLIDLTDKDQLKKSVPPLRKLTDGYYSWKTLSWQPEGILAVSNQTADGKYNVFRVDGEHGTVQRLTQSAADQSSPNKFGNKLLFQSWQSGTSQLHWMDEGKEYQITDVKVGLTSPVVSSDHHLYALGLNGGRFHVYRIAPSALHPKEVRTEDQNKGDPWKANLISFEKDQIHSYTPFFSQGGARLEDVGAFLSTGGVGGASASVSDLMKDYRISLQFAYLGRYGVNNAFLLFQSEKGRSSLDLGAYHIIQPRLDNLLSSYNQVRTYFHHESGFLTSFQYPLGAMSYFDVQLRLAVVSRSDFSDGALLGAWDAQNPGSEMMASPVVRLGYDNILYEAYAGPLRGFGSILELETSYFPSRNSVNERARLDLSYYYQVAGSAVLGLQGLAGASWYGTYGNSFLVSSDDIMRGYPIFDNHLFGNYVLASKAEFRFPIGSLFRFPILRGMVALDYGSIFLTPSSVSDGLASSTTTGLLMNIPPLSMSFLLSFPGKVALGAPDNPVFHFLFRYLYL